MLSIERCSSNRSQIMVARACMHTKLFKMKCLQKSDVIAKVNLNGKGGEDRMGISCQRALQKKKIFFFGFSKVTRSCDNVKEKKKRRTIDTFVKYNCMSNQKKITRISFF